MRTQKPADSEATAFEKEYNKSDRESNRERARAREWKNKRAMGVRGEGNELC